MGKRLSSLICCSLLVLIVFGCKNETPIDDLEVVKPVLPESGGFKVTIKAVVKQDDDFALFYTIDGTTNFTIAPLWQPVKGSSDIQEIKYSLPNTVTPTQIRMDFGLKQNQEDIELKSVLFENKGKKREIAGNELATFFRADATKCSFDSSGVIKAVVKDGKKESPSLYPQEANLGPELKKLGM